MINIFKLLYYIIDIGIKITLSTGLLFNPAYQERINAVQDLTKQEQNKYECNFEYSDKWQQTFILKKEK